MPDVRDRLLFHPEHENLQKVHAEKRRHNSHVQLSYQCDLSLVSLRNSTRVITLLRSFLHGFSIFNLHDCVFLKIDRFCHFCVLKALLTISSRRGLTNLGIEKRMNSCDQVAETCCKCSSREFIIFLYRCSRGL